MEYYNWLLALHIMSFVSWMAMLFYQPRLYVYHMENIENKGFVDVVKIQENKLYSYIGLPAMVATIITGVGMLMINPTLFKSGMWIHIKLTLAILLVVYHFSLAWFKIKIQSGKCTKSGKFFRVYNEIPTILMILIVALAIVKPI